MNIIEKIDETFALDSNYKEMFDKFETECYKIHEDVNQKYDDNPYSLHLKMVTNMLTIVFEEAWKSEFIVYDWFENPLLNSYIKCYYAALLHDAIEDARLTYNDILNKLSPYTTFNYYEPGDFYDSYKKLCVLKIKCEEIADIVYAVTNEKGKNRSERANDKYYQGIRENKLAVIVKICDRLANVLYSKMMNSRMLDVYKKEHEHFINSIIEDKDSEFYKKIELHFTKLYNEELI